MEYSPSSAQRQSLVAFNGYQRYQQYQNQRAYSQSPITAGNFHKKRILMSPSIDLNISSHPTANSTMTIQDLQNECLDLRKSVSPSMSSTSGSSRLHIASGDEEDELGLESGDMYSSSIHGDMSSRSSSATSSNFDYPYLKYHKRNSSGDSMDQYTYPGVPVVYHQNMARKFPGSENRTPEQQEQRQKNTVAARYSRAKAKMMENIVERESVEAKQENFTSKRNIAARNVYANMMLRILGKDEIDWNAKWAKANVF